MPKLTKFAIEPNSNFGELIIIVKATDEENAAIAAEKYISKRAIETAEIYSTNSTLPVGLHDFTGK
jgi:hypothetical protein